MSPWAEQPGFDSGHRSFFFAIASRLALGATQPPNHWIPLDLFPGVKQLGHETHPPPSSAEVKIGWRFTSTVPYVLIMM
jgi:hypothetical protein